MYQEEFNTITDLRPYLLRHPDGEMIRVSCLHFLGDKAQEWWNNTIENKPYNVINEIHFPLGPTHRLVRWANYIRGYYGYPVYLVGSSLHKTMPRDIDVCCIIPDDLFCKRYHIEDIKQHVSKKISGTWEDDHWRWSEDVVKKTYHGWDFTHMNIDFKVISETENKEQGYEGKPKHQLDTRK